MHTSDWLIIASTVTIMVASMIGGLRYHKSFLGVWVAFGILAPNTLWLNHYVRPWGTIVFFAFPSVPLALVAVVALWLRLAR